MATRKWLPTDLTSVSLETWYRLVDPAGALVVGADAGVSGTAIGTTWIDRSGKGRTLTLEGSGLTFNPNAFGTGKAGIESVGSGGWRTAAGRAFPQTVLGTSIVLRSDAGSGDSRAVSLITPNGADPYDGAGVIPVSKIGGEAKVGYWYSFAASDTPVTLGAPTLVDGVPTSLTTAKTVVNGVDGGTMSAANLGAYSQDRLGVMSTGQGGNYVKGAIAEMVLWSGVISAGELAQMQGYYAWNNGLQALLPAGHAYKTAAPTVTTADTGSSQTGTLAANESADTAAISATIPQVGTLAVTERNDTASGTTATVTTGALAATEQRDIASASATTGGGANLAATEQPDTAAISGSTTTVGALAGTEARDTAALTAQQGSNYLAATEQADTAQIATSTRTSGALAGTEPGDTASVSATSGITSTLATTEGQDTAFATASTRTVGALAAVEQADTLAAIGGVPQQAALAATENRDTAAIAAVSGLQNFAVLAAIEASDTAAVSAVQVARPNFLLAARRAGPLIGGARQAGPATLTARRGAAIRLTAHRLTP
jgi:hypothetical protein